jgi:hypothetical protein
MYYVILQYKIFFQFWVCQTQHVKLCDYPIYQNNRGLLIMNLTKQLRINKILSNVRTVN